MDEHLILVDANDNIIGSDRKMLIHRQGLRHRAFSIFIFNDQGQLMLQQRATEKYHSADLWTNSCCGHPRWGEEVTDAVHRRLEEEMGFNCELVPIAHFSYYAQVSNDLIENEYDHIYAGIFNNEPNINPNEAKNWSWEPLENIKEKIHSAPEMFTVWFKKIIDAPILSQLTRWKDNNCRSVGRR